MYLLQFLFVALVVCAGDADSNVIIFRQDYTYDAANEAFYKYHVSPRTWENAKKQCEAERTTLYFPENEKEVETVNNIKNITQAEPATEVTEGPLWMWIGVTSEDKRGITIDGRSIDYVYHVWDNDEPNNMFGEEHCIVIMQNNKLNDYHCKALMPFACKLKLSEYQNNETLQNYELNVAPQDVNGENDHIKIVFKSLYYLDYTDSFYRYHNESVEWKTAVSNCERENAKLFYPANEREAREVVAISDKIQWEEWIWAGGSYSDGIYKTVDNHNIDSRYNTWYPKERNVNKGCLVLLKDGSYRDRPCDKKYPYICKRPYF